MSKDISAKPDEMREIAAKLNGEVERYESLVKDLYTTVENACSQSWIGIDSQTFSKSVDDFKPLLLNLENDIKNFANAITSGASEIETAEAQITRYMS